jgi:hypothetical protein
MIAAMSARAAHTARAGPNPLLKACGDWYPPAPAKTASRCTQARWVRARLRSPSAPVSRESRTFRSERVSHPASSHRNNAAVLDRRCWQSVR